MIVFFKQKTAYEMRISDWSSDVCSSDLDICANRFHRIKFAGRHLLECGGMENIIGTLHCLTDAVVIPYITDIESQLLVRQRNAHVVLLLLITAKDTDLPNARIQKTVQDRSSK